MRWRALRSKSGELRGNSTAHSTTSSVTFLYAPMRSHIRVPLDALEELQKQLEALPPQQPEDVSRCEAVKLLAPTIENLLSRGYNVPRIARELSSRGLEVTPAVLKAYLNRARRGAAQKPGRARPKSAKAKSSAQPGSDPEASNSTREESKQSQASPMAGATRETTPKPADTIPDSTSRKIGGTSGELEETPGGSLRPVPEPTAAGHRKSLFRVNEDTRDI